MNNPTQSDRLALSVMEMARTLGVSRSTAYALTRRAGFPVCRIGDRVLIPVDALREWLTSQGEALLNERDDVI